MGKRLKASENLRGILFKFEGYTFNFPKHINEEL